MFTVSIAEETPGQPGRASGAEQSETDRLKTELKESRAVITAMLEGSGAVLRHREFGDAARAIFDTCKELIGASAGYVALLSEDGSENEVLFLDAGGLPCSVDPDLPMPIRGLRERAYREQRAVFDNDFFNSDWMKLMPKGHVRLDNVLFAPLVLDGVAVGLMGLANKPGGFTNSDAAIALTFGEYAAIALQNSRALEQLEQSEKRFRAVAQTAIDAIITIDSEGIISYWNESAEKMFGYTRAEAEGQKLAIIIPERYQEAHREGVARVVSGGERKVIGKTIELTAKRKGGEEFPIELSLSSYSLGEEMYFTGIVHDIRKRKEAEAALMESHKTLERRVEERTAELARANEDLRREISVREKAEVSLVEERKRLFALLDELPGYVYLQGQDYSIRFANRRFREYFGDSVDRKCFQAIKNLERPCEVCPTFEVFRTGQPVEWEQTLDDGKTFQIYDYPITDVDGTKLVLELGIDVSQRKKAESELRRLVHAIEQAAESIIITDTTGVIQYVNPAFERVSGYSREEAVGSSVEIIASGKHPQEFFEEMWRTISRGEIWKSRVVNKRKSGELYEEDVVISPIADADGRITSYVSVQRDMSRELMLSRAREYFTSVTSHELRTPLTKLGLVRLLLLNLGQKFPELEDVERIKQTLEGSIADFDRIITASEMFTELMIASTRKLFRQVNIFLVLQYCVETARNSVRQEGRHIEIRTDFGALERNSYVYGIQKMIERAVYEILSNAIKYTPDGRKITVLGREESGRMVIEVADEGIGVAPDKKALIFEPFFSLEEHSTGVTSQFGYKGGGIGMGLTLAQLIMEHHEGSLEFESEGEGHGSTVRLVFPS